MLILALHCALLLGFLSLGTAAHLPNCTKGPCKPWTCNFHGCCEVISIKGQINCSCSVDKDGNSFSADDCCLTPLCNGKLLHSCSGHGKCKIFGVAGLQYCECNAGFFGRDCSLFCPVQVTSTSATSTTLTTSSSTTRYFTTPLGLCTTTDQCHNNPMFGESYYCSGILCTPCPGFPCGPGQVCMSNGGGYECVSLTTTTLTTLTTTPTLTTTSSSSTTSGGFTTAAGYCTSSDECHNNPMFGVGYYCSDNFCIPCPGLPCGIAEMCMPNGGGYGCSSSTSTPFTTTPTLTTTSSSSTTSGGFTTAAGYCTSSDECHNNPMFGVGYYCSDNFCIPCPGLPCGIAEVCMPNGGGYGCSSSTSMPFTTTPTLTTTSSPTFTTSPTMTTSSSSTTSGGFTTAAGYCTSSDECHNNPMFGVGYYCSDNFCIPCPGLPCGIAEVCMPNGGGYGCSTATTSSSSSTIPSTTTSTSSTRTASSTSSPTFTTSTSSTTSSMSSGSSLTFSTSSTSPLSTTSSPENTCNTDGDCHNNPVFGTSFACLYFGMTGMCQSCPVGCSITQSCFSSMNVATCQSNGGCATDADCHNTVGASYYCNANVCQFCSHTCTGGLTCIAGTCS